MDFAVVAVTVAIALLTNMALGFVVGIGVHWTLTRLADYLASKRT